MSAKTITFLEDEEEVKTSEILETEKSANFTNYNAKKLNKDKQRLSLFKQKLPITACLHLFF